MRSREGFTFVMLLVSGVLPGGYCASILSKCPSMIVMKWDSITSWQEDNFTLTLNLEGLGSNCTFGREVEVEVFAVKQLEDSFDCEHLEDGDKVKKFFHGHEFPAKYVFSDRERKLTFGFISGDFVFRIGNKHCTQIKSYTKSSNQISVANFQSQCTATRQNEAKVEGRQPFWEGDTCKLEISTFQLPRCYLLTNYTTASVYLVEVGQLQGANGENGENAKNANCGEMGVRGDLNPLWNPQLPRRNKLLAIDAETQIKDVVFSNLEKEKLYCVFVSMWDSYPICSRSSVDEKDLCYYFPVETFQCPLKSID